MGRHCGPAIITIAANTPNGLDRVPDADGDVHRRGIVTCAAKAPELADVLGRRARVLDRRARASARSAPNGCRRRPATRSWCARCTAASAAAPRRSSFTAACRRASTSGCARRFRPGEFPAPVKYGYASVGMVEDGPSELRGRHVFALYPHQTRYVVPAQAVHVLPAGVPAGARRAGRQPRDRDQRDLGRASARRRSHLGRRRRHGRLPGCVAGRPHRRAATSSWSTSTRRGRRSRARSACASPRPTTASENADVVIHASGSAVRAGRWRCAWPASRRRSSRRAGTATVPVAAPLGGAFHARRLTLQSSQVGTRGGVAARAVGHARAAWDWR